VGAQRHAPAALLPGRDPSGRLDGPQGRFEPVRKISPLPGIDPRTAHCESLYRLRCAGPQSIGSQAKT
jgi:hypothetical protein